LEILKRLSFDLLFASSSQRVQKAIDSKACNALLLKVFSFFWQIFPADKLLGLGR
jgi:hypothetical protein